MGDAAVKVRDWSRDCTKAARERFVPILQEWGTLALLVIFCLALTLWLFGKAWAHGEADWIEKGQYKAPSGSLCCGPRDCVQLPDGAVTLANGTFMFKLDGRLLSTPVRESQVSTDDHYWACIGIGGDDKPRVRCFFRPAMGV